MRYVVAKCAGTTHGGNKWVVVPSNAGGLLKGLWFGPCRSEHYSTRSEARRFLRPLAMALKLAA